jgi:hypothetical protein
MVSHLTIVVLFLSFIQPVSVYSRSHTVLGGERESTEELIIGEKEKDLLFWMRTDLEQYAENFEAFFNSKLARVKRHQQQRQKELDLRLLSLRARLETIPSNQFYEDEIKRLTEIHKAFGFVAEYIDANDFASRFVGPERNKVLRTPLTASEITKMNLPGTKTLYVDTWGVPFFNTGTQTLEEAKRGVIEALSELHLNEAFHQVGGFFRKRFLELMSDGPLSTNSYVQAIATLISEIRK